MPFNSAFLQAGRLAVAAFPAHPDPATVADALAGGGRCWRHNET